jgi:ATP-dependent Lon protease
MNFYRLIHLVAAVFLSIFAAGAQNQQQAQTPEEREKQLLESIDKETERLRILLDLEYWQEFYVDSTLTHDLTARMEELLQMQQAKVENTDLYQSISDKWMEQIDRSYKSFFTQEQWNKYMKAGGQRAQRERDKRREKAAKATADRKK